MAEYFKDLSPYVAISQQSQLKGHIQIDKIRAGESEKRKKKLKKKKKNKILQIFNQQNEQT